MMKPIVNLNGTGRQALIDARTNAMDALYKAIQAVRETMPHGRDYPGAVEQYRTDRDLHFQRVAALSAMLEDIGQEALAIQREGQGA